MDKLKSALMNHGEKVLAAICALFGFLAFSSAHWGADNRSPLELETLTSAAEAKILQNEWPEEERAEFQKIKDVRALTAVDAQDKTDPAEYAIAAINPSLIRSREKRSNVAVVAPTDPIADALVFVLAMPPEEEDPDAEDAAGDGTDGEGGTGAKDKGDTETSEEDELEKMMMRKYGIKTAAVGGMTEGGSYPGSEGGLPIAGGSFPGAASGAGGPPGVGGGAGGIRMSPSEGEDMYDDMMYGGSELYDTYGAGMMSEKKNVRVSAGVSVRMIVNLQEQRNLIRKALHLTSNVAESHRHIQYIDLQVERRQKQNGPAGWGEWEAVSSEDLGEILEDSFGIDRDIVSPAVTRNTITMPLPRRATGSWDPSVASHPRVEDFQLSEEEKSLIDKWNQKVTERLAEEQAEAPIEVEARGFSSFVQSATDVSSMYGNVAMDEDYDSMYTDYENDMNEGQGGKLSAADRAVLDATRATAEMRLLLVRFMDFTVERGHSYQYRVRLEMKNPNYNHPLDELEDPALGTEPTVFSSWSSPTPKSYVPLASRMYVTDVDSRPGRQESVVFTVYTDTTETGLPVINDVKVFAGMPIAGMRKQEVVDLTEDKLEEREVTLRTDAVLAAVEPTYRLSTTDHPELRSVLGRLERGAKPIADQVCVIDADGSIKLRSVGDLASQEKMDRAEAEFILKQYEQWRPNPQAAGGGFFGTSEGSGYDDEMGGYPGLGMNQASSSSGGYFGGGGEAGKRMSSRARSRAKRSGAAAGAGALRSYGPGGPPTD